MKIRFNKDHLDYKAGKEYDDILEPTAVYLVRLGVAKEVIGKGGKSKAPTKPKKAKEQKAPVETKELKTPVETK